MWTALRSYKVLETKAKRWEGDVTDSVVFLWDSHQTYPRKNLISAWRLPFFQDSLQWDERNIFFNLVISDILLLLFWCGSASRVSRKLLFYLQPGIHIVCEETCSTMCFGEMPDVMNFYKKVTLANGFLNIWRTPGATQHTLFGWVIASTGRLREGFLHLLSNTGPSQREDQFASMTKRKNWVI